LFGQGADGRLVDEKSTFFLPPHFGSESITALRDSLNQPWTVQPKSPPKSRDIDRQVGLFDEAVRPKGFEQILLFEETTAVTNQQQKQVEHLWRQLNNPTALQKTTLKDF
jgi:hypothetical protein